MKIEIIQEYDEFQYVTNAELELIIANYDSAKVLDDWQHGHQSRVRIELRQRTARGINVTEVPYVRTRTKVYGPFPTRDAASTWMEKRYGKAKGHCVKENGQVIASANITLSNNPLVKTMVEPP